MYTLLQDLEAMRDAVAWAHAHNERDSLLAAMRGGLRKWIASMADIERGYQDQPIVMVEAIDAVQSRDAERKLQSGHHWSMEELQKPTGGSVMTSGARYRENLAEDMTRVASLGTGHLERILEVMAESDGGRDVLYGSSPTAVDFGRALRGTLGKEGADEMLTRVRAKVVEPHEHLRGREAEMVWAMRRRGHLL